MNQNFFNLFAAILLTIGTIILIALTIIWGINGNTEDAIAGLFSSCIVSVSAIAIWVKFAQEL